MGVRGWLASKLPDIVAQAVFDVARMVKALLHQFLDSGLDGGTLDGGDKGIPFRRDIRVGRQTGHVGEFSASVYGFPFLFQWEGR